VIESTGGSLGTLTRGLRALEELSGRQLTVAELARRLDCHRQAAYRVIWTLEAAGWVKRAGEHYALTTRAWSIGMQSLTGADEVRRRAIDRLDELAASHGETTGVAIYENGEAVHIAQAAGHNALIAATSIGGRAPAHTVSVGKVLLAFGPLAERERVLRGPLGRFTPSTIVDPLELQAELDRARHDGFAVNTGEFRVGVGGVAVPLRSANGAIAAAVGVSGPADRVLARRDELVAALRAFVTSTSVDAQAS
jgi:IclR family KDG regulon transcriptional repressor